MSGRTYPQFLRQHATWLDKAVCFVRGHTPPVALEMFAPVMEAEDRRRLREMNVFCGRCGKENP